MAKQKKYVDIELVMVDLMYVGQKIERRVSDLLKEYALTMPQYNILRILRGAETSLSMGEVKDRMIFGTSDVSRLVDRLVKKEFLSRQICSDNRRKMDVCITPKALTVLEEIDEAMDKNLFPDFQKRLESETVKSIRKGLEDIRGVLDDRQT